MSEAICQSCGGVIFIDVPCVEGFEKYLRNSANYFNHEHINYFSLQSLDHLFANQGCRRISGDEESIKLLDFEQPELVIEALYVTDQNYNASFKRDARSEKSILNYFALIEKKESEKLEEIKHFIREGEEDLVIWGTGSYCMKILEEIGDLKDKIVFFVDNNKRKHGQMIDGKPIVEPVKLKDYEGKIKVLILIMQQANDAVKELDEMGVACKRMIG